MANWQRGTVSFIDPVRNYGFIEPIKFPNKKVKFLFTVITGNRRPDVRDEVSFVTDRNSAPDNPVAFRVRVERFPSTRALSLPRSKSIGNLAAASVQLFDVEFHTTPQKSGISTSPAPSTPSKQVLSPNGDDQRGKLSSDSLSHRPTSNQALLRGKIEKLVVEEGYGFMQPFNGLPPSYSPTNVYFRIDSVKSAGLQLLENDEMEFMLGYKDRAKPRAIRASLWKPVSRTPEQISNWLLGIEKKLLLQFNADSESKQHCFSHSSADSDSEDESCKTDLMVELSSVPGAWEAAGNCHRLTNAMVSRLLDVLIHLELKATTLRQSFAGVLERLTKTAMFDGRRSALLRYVTDSVTERNEKELVKIRRLLLSVMQNVTGCSGSLLTLIKPMVSSDTDTLDNFLYAALKKQAMEDMNDIDNMDWCDLPLVPSAKEIFGNIEQFLSQLNPVVVKGSYSSCDEYLDVYFRLLRADCFSNLCRCIQRLLAGNLDLRDMSLYTPVKLQGVAVTRNDSGLALLLQVNSVTPVADWKRSSKLMFGNLLCISPTGTFKDPIWATSAKRDAELLVKNSCVFVELCSEHNVVSDAEALMLIAQAGTQMIMAESPNYYLAYKPVLNTLQRMNSARLPFQDELLCKAYPKQKTPKYVLDEFTEHKATEAALKALARSWPASLQVRQKTAMTNAFLRQVACIQGPPGTGKTFIGIHIVCTILAMKCCPDTPILVLTYKNHALDEFLKELLNYFPDDIIRIGRGSNESTLEKCNLRERKFKCKKSKSLYEKLIITTTKLEQVKSELESASRCLNDRQRLTLHTILQYGLSLEQVASLLRGCKQQPFRERYNTAIELLESRNKQDVLSSSDVVRCLEYALRQWMPNAAVTAAEERKYLRTNTVLPNFTSSAEVKRKQKEEEEEMNEDDIQQMQNERMMGIVSDDFQKNITLVQFRSVDVPCFFGRLQTFAEQLPSKQLMATEDLWTLTNEERLKLIQHLLLLQSDEARERFKTTLASYKRLLCEKKELDDEHSARVISESKIVGMTMTGASINSKLLAAVKPAIVIVEEAAEILEPQIIAVLGPWVEHLIMIGDHKQLRPTVADHYIESKLHLDVSMMERLINNGMPYDVLVKQNRMRPEFAELLLDIYPELQSAISVVGNRPAACVEKSMFFWDHRDPEVSSRGYSNPREAQRVVKLALFLLQHGCEVGKITILAAYQRQVAEIRALVRQAETNHPLLFGRSSSSESKDDGKDTTKKYSLRVHTIDMYQGDENDFVIVSLVRSNENKSVGFLKLLNRRCVAQSRARCGLYFIGNSETLSAASKYWNDLIAKMRTNDCVDRQLVLQCPRHSSTKLLVTTPDDITLESFCRIKCKQRFQMCTIEEHTCDNSCQPYHDHPQCPYTVSFLRRCGHAAKKKCYENERDISCSFSCSRMMKCTIHLCKKLCSPDHDHFCCTEKVEYNCSKCGHHNDRMCWQSEKQVRCEHKVSFNHADCGHPDERYCYEHEDDIKCKRICLRFLPCKHLCKLKCSELCKQSECAMCKRKEERRYTESLRAIDQELKAVQHEEILRRVELIPSGDTADDYFSVHDAVTKFVHADHRWKPTVTKIERVYNSTLLSQYLECKKKLFDPGNEKFKFHGTSAEAVAAIVQDGFRLPERRGMYGKGIYFATDSSKSAQEKYTKGSYMLIYCRVAIGRCKTVESACRGMTLEELNGESYDSIYAKRDTREGGGVKFDEYVVFRPQQALPQYIIHYTYERLLFR